MKYINFQTEQQEFEVIFAKTKLLKMYRCELGMNLNGESIEVLKQIPSIFIDIFSDI